jgi:homogentisate 1,2-dioxygenase
VALGVVEHYIHLPKGVTFRHMPDDRDHVLLVVESPGPVRMAEHENVGRHTPIDPTMLEVPEIVDYGFPAEPEYEVRLRHKGGHSSIFYKNDPLKVVGWKGDLFPFKLNIRAILPIMWDRIHLAPSSWATFEAPGFAVLSFVPQIAVSDLNAAELPSYHRNIDMDEVMLNHADEDPSGRRPGLFRHTPQGVLHGAPPRSLPCRIPQTAPARPAPHRLVGRRRHLPPARRLRGICPNGGINGGIIAAARVAPANQFC